MGSVFFPVFGKTNAVTCELYLIVTYRRQGEFKLTFLQQKNRPFLFHLFCIEMNHSTKYNLFYIKIIKFFIKFLDVALYKLILDNNLSYLSPLFLEIFALYDCLKFRYKSLKIVKMFCTTEGIPRMKTSVSLVCFDKQETQLTVF